jgi:hypothetical protein
MPGFGIIMPIGPGEREIERAGDVLDSLFAYEPGCGWVVLIDDVKIARGLEDRFPRPRGCKVQVFVDPRRGKGNGWSGGMCVGVAAGVRWLARETDAPFALRLDTDSLVIAPFADKITSFFLDRPRVGLAGSYSRYPNGGTHPSLNIWAPMIEPYTFRFRLYRNRFGLPLHARAALFGRARRRRLFLRRALANGYRPGEFCSGGGYAVSRALMDSLRDDADFADSLLFRGTRITEDNMMAVACRAAGLELADYNGEGEPFGVTGVTLAGEPGRLLELGYSVIHPVKNAPGWDEAAIRAFFRSVRGQRRPTATDYAL